LTAQLTAQLTVQLEFSPFRRVGSGHKKTACFLRFLSPFSWGQEMVPLLVLCGFWGILKPF
jgi:hypothetical protein